MWQMLPEKAQTVAEHDDHKAALESAMLLPDNNVISDLLQSESIDVSTFVLRQ